MRANLPRRPHVLGIDDGPFDKHVRDATTPVVGVMMEGADLVEAVAVTRFQVDGADVTGFLADWIGSLRFRPALQGVLFSGITMAGLAVIDAGALAERLGLPVVLVNRREPQNERLRDALLSAGLSERIGVLERAPDAFAVGGVYAAAAGAQHDLASRLVCATLGKADLPEPIRLAHLIARAMVAGESRGRV